MSFRLFLLQMAKLLQKLKISADVAIKAALGASLLILLALMFPRGESLELEFRVGGIWAQKDLIAPFSFPVLREEKEYLNDAQAARASVLQVYERDSAVGERQVRRLEDFFRHVHDVLKVNRQ